MIILEFESLEDLTFNRQFIQIQYLEYLYTDIYIY